MRKVEGRGHFITLNDLIGVTLRRLSLLFAPRAQCAMRAPPHPAKPT